MKPTDPIQDFEKLFGALQKELGPELEKHFDQVYIKELDRTEITKARDMTTIEYRIVLYKHEEQS